MLANDLSVLTVSYFHARHIRLHFELIEKINENLPVAWTVVQNTPEEECELEEHDFITTVPGIAWADLPQKHVSVHHGHALNRGIKAVDTKYLLVLDPDFYIIARDWIENVLSHMEAKDLSFFGSPWHPRSTSKPRYFPAPHCLFIDLERVGVENLDFVPNLPSERRKEKLSRQSIGTKFLRRVKALFPDEIQSRARIGGGFDTGELIHKRYAGLVNEHECLQPIFDPSSATLLRNQLPFEEQSYDRFLDRILPDKYSYIPKKPGYFTKEIPEDMKCFKRYVEECECFAWNGRGFGIHHRGMILDSSGQRDDFFQQFADRLRSNFGLASHQEKSLS